ncbi:hypothetical protein [Neobacillus dielmonensis]|uniref:hypothetical protein n=1 Tax=Neobacillus dielmonensis TaxID=1347369 RepID=UPI0005AA666F|nr:hypothetical protein [Neobacillus dielmonensis]
MNNLSDKELLEIMTDFPKHELNTKQRTEILKKISGTVGQKPRNKWNIQWLGAIAALLVLAIVAPMLYFSNSSKEFNSASSTKSKMTEVQQADYFALNDKGEIFYADSNFGIPNKVSLLAPKDWIAKDDRSVAKMMIFLWGDYDKSFANKKLTVNAVHEKTGVKEELANTSIAGPMNGADAHALTSLKPFSFSGKWNLQFMVDGKDFAAFPIYVKEPYIQTDKWTLMLSQEDLYPGFYEDVPIEVTGEGLPEQLELEVFALETAESTTFTFGNKTDYTTIDGKKISRYQGNFQIKKSGKYRFTAVQSSQAVDVRKPVSN